jgi:WD40 repeat protein
LEHALTSLRSREPEHFLTFHSPDGISARRPVPNDALLASLKLPKRIFARAQYAYWFQRAHPVRVTLSVPLTGLAQEKSTAGSDATSLSTSPYQAMKGPVPSSTGHSSFITSLAWIDYPTRFLLTGGKDGTIKIWR